MKKPIQRQELHDFAYELFEETDRRNQEQVTKVKKSLKSKLASLVPFQSSPMSPSKVEAEKSHLITLGVIIFMILVSLLLRNNYLSNQIKIKEGYYQAPQELFQQQHMNQNKLHK